MASVTVGYKYYLGLHMICTAGPVDCVLSVSVDKKSAWTGKVTSGAFTISAENLFGGGDPSNGQGGISGVVSFCPGGPSQTANAYLSGQLAGAETPPFRGVAGFVIQQCYVGTSTYLKPWSFRLQRIHTRQNGIAQWYDAKAEIKVLGNTQVGVLTEDTNLDAMGSSEDGLSDGTYYEFDVAPGNAIIIRRAENGNYKAWSYTPYDGYSGFPDSWTMRFGLRDMTNGTVNYYWVNNYATNADAWNSVADLPVVVTAVGSTYRLFVYDANVDDNREGGSYQVSLGTGASDMNPAHIIRECLTDPDWGMGYNEDDIDDPAFTAAADTLFDEGFGLSLIWDDQTEIQEFITQILQHINAVVYVNRRTGRFILKLIRADYVVGDLVSLTEDDIQQVTNFKRTKWGELTTSATVSYWDTATNTTATVNVQDIALETMQDAAIDYSVTYKGITNAALAARVAQRDLHVLGSEIATCTIYVGRKKAKGFNPGDVALVTWPGCALDATPMRIVGIALGDGKNNSLMLTVCEDVFSLDSAPIAIKPPPIGLPSPGGAAAPIAITNQLAMEAPYVVMISELTQATADSMLATNELAGYLLTCATRPSSSSLNYELQVAAPTTYEDIKAFEWCPLGVTDVAFDRLDTAITFASGTDLDLVVLDTCAIWDGEIVRIDAIDPVALTVTLGRGCADTVPVKHLLGSFIYFFDESIGTDNFEYVSTETINVRCLTRIGTKLLNPSLATPMTVVMNQRAARPYPPANVKIGGTAYPTSVSGGFTITWNHRNRQLQARQIVDTTESATALADNTRYILTFKNASGTVLVTKTDIGTGTAAVTLNYTGNVTCELSTQDAIATSWQKHSFVFAYTPPGGSPTNTITATAYTPVDETPIVDGGVVT